MLVFCFVRAVIYTYNKIIILLVLIGYRKTKSIETYVIKNVVVNMNYSSTIKINMFINVLHCSHFEIAIEFCILVDFT